MSGTAHARAALVAAWFFAVTGSPVTMFADRFVSFAAPQFRPAIVHATTCSYVFRAYPLWLLAHPTQDCPRELAELLPYARYPELYDPGTAAYQMRCDPGTHTIAVWSPDDYGGSASNTVSIERQGCRFDVRPWARW
jgi:hypothetical protein